jgi:hypothetical protein
MTSYLYTCHETLNLQIPTYLNQPQTTFLGLIFNFFVLHTQKHKLKTTFFIIIFNS